MSAVWLEQRERGNRLALRTAVRLLLSLGHSAGRLLLYPITAYFVAFSVHARRASRAYLTRVLGRPAKLAEVARHYLTFARVLHDRLYFLAGRSGEFTVERHGAEAVEQALAAGRGCLLLGAHLGSFEVLRVLGSFERKLPVNVLLYPDNATNTDAALGALRPELQERVIPLGRPQTLLRVRECLERNEIVGMLADRALSAERSVQCRFLGAPARFPQGPLRVASILQAPVVLFFGLYLGGRRYALHFEPFAGDVEAYAARLEHYCRLAPYNWFNFYDFWRA
jgi:predicted LPLAT superfamily acyltransferase